MNANFPNIAIRRLSLVLLVSLLLGLLAPLTQAQTAAPTPTPTPGTAPQLTIQAATINVRGGPGTAYPIIGSAKKGQQFTISGRDAARQWWRIDFKGKPGWVSTALVKAGAGADKVQPVANIPPPPKRAAPEKTPAVTPLPAGPPLPPYQESVTLGEGTSYPVRAAAVSGWGYQFVDQSKDYDLLVNRDIFGVFLNELWPDLLKLHPKGLQITFRDPDPGVNYPQRYQWSGGFGDGESAYVVAHRCVGETVDPNGTIWQNELVTCGITLVAPGPGLTDITIVALVLGYGKTYQGNFNPVFSQAPFIHLGQATREVETGQWRWADPFLQVVSFKPVPAAPVAAAPAAPKGPLPPPAGHIAFTRGRDPNAPIPAGYNDIAVVDVKTSEVRVVAQNGRQPDMRNDGRIVYNGEGGGRDDLQAVALDGRDLGPVSVHPEDSAPHWSDGASLVFHSALADGLDRIFVQWDGNHRGEPQYLEVDNGANLRPFTGRYPVWVGDRVAYSGCDEWARRSICGLRIVSIGGLMSSKSSRNISLLTQNPEDRPTDAYGETILLVSPKSGNWDVYTILASGGKPRNLTNSPSQDLGGTFSPDGNYIAFMSDRGGWGIWIMEADSANPRLLVAVPEGFGKLWDQERLSWGP